MAPSTVCEMLDLWICGTSPRLSLPALHSDSNPASPPQNSSIGGGGAGSLSFEAQYSGHAGSTRVDATRRVKLVAKTSSHLQESPAVSPSASTTESYGLSNTFEMSTDQSPDAI